MNENSLKRLNGYLDNLQKPGPRSVQPMKLTFYVRDTKDSSDVQPDLFTSGTVSINILLLIFATSVFYKSKRPPGFQGSALWVSPCKQMMSWAQWWMSWSPAACPWNIWGEWKPVQRHLEVHLRPECLSTDLSNGIRVTTPSLASETLRRSCSRPGEWSLHSG